MKIRTFNYFFREAFKSFWRNSMMTVASVLTVTLSLFILGLFVTTVWNLNHMASYLENQVELSVYLKDGLTTEQVMNVGQRIRALPEMKSLSFTNKDEALANFRERLGEQATLLDSINGNPLPSSYEVVFANPEAVRQGASAVAKFAEVETVQYGQETVEQLFQFARIVRIGGAILILFLAFATLFIISNTIRLTVFARRQEIQIMKYVGATNGFIRWPFVIEGMMLGFFGSLIAGACLWKVYGWMLGGLAASGFAFLPLIPTYPFVGKVACLLIVAGVAIGALGSVISVRKYMKV